MPKPWKEPQDPKRSFMLRTEGLMRKCKDLTNLGVQVAIYIEDVKNGTVLRYKTDPGLLPSWPKVAPLPEEPNAETEPPAVFFGSLRLTCPSISESSSPLKPTWADLEISKASCDSNTSPPSQKSQQRQENRPTTKKRAREVSPDDAEEQRRKRERSTSTWFDD
ncbi:hypothetical protein FBEOM_14266 [Fusarium beomiforme]|uniref:Uncharacterized protein n=1 Tax=Fusarium beomiforme TaxID=44412 RepID=A0A9P5DM73_9HYPO|nr:hypothetical protein FBEOM_14266 [Fusarium beomiforme]